MTQTPRHAACPACGAALRPGSPWCTLCYTDLRPRPVEPPPAAPAAAASAPAGDPLTQPLLDFIAPPPVPPGGGAPQPPAPPPTGKGWPCLTCGAINALDASDCVTCGAPFLGAVGVATRPTMVLPLVGDIFLLSRSQRLLGALGVVLLLMAVVTVLTLLLSPGSAPSTEPVQQVTQEPTVATIQPAPTATTAPGFPTAFPTVSAAPTP